MPPYVCYHTNYVEKWMVDTAVDPQSQLNYGIFVLFFLALLLISSHAWYIF